MNTELKLIKARQRAALQEKALTAAVELLKQPLYQTIAGLVIIEQLQRFNLIGQNVSSALEVGVVVESLAKSAAGLIPKVSIGS